MFPGGPPEGQRGGAAGGGFSSVEKGRALWQGAKEDSAESSKHSRGMDGLLLRSHWYKSQNYTAARLKPCICRKSRAGIFRSFKKVST